MSTHTRAHRTTALLVGIAVIAAIALFVARSFSVTPAHPGSQPTRSQAARSAEPAGAGTAAVAATHTVKPAARPRTAPDTGCIIVRYAPGTAKTGRGSRVGSGDTVLETAPAGMTTAEYAAEVAARPGVLAAEPDYLLEPAVSYTATPNDPDFNNTTSYVFGSGTAQVSVASAKSWALHGTYSSDYDRVWPALNSAEATAGQVHVAVLDTGFYFDHPDARFSNIRAAIDECATYNPNTGQLTTDAVVAPVPLAAIGADAVGVASHGTMTASEIGASANNLEGSLGATYDTVVDVYKVQGVASQQGQGFEYGEALIPESAIINAINDAVAASQREDYRLVINISLVLIDPESDKLQLLKQAVAAARAKGVVVVGAAGNEGSPAVLYPAACPGAIAVGASTVSTQGVARDRYSNYGSALDITAPGTNIWGPTKPGQVSGPGDTPGYTWWSGTSMASPMVASAAALLMRIEPTLTATEVVDYLQRGATDLEAEGWDNRTGWGSLDVYNAYYLLAAPRTTSNVKARYALDATIDFTVVDRDSGPDVTTYYRRDGGAVLSGPSVTFSSLGHHWIEYWSVDRNGVREQPSHIESFDIVMPDTTPPITTSDARSSYAGKATIRLSATDSEDGAWGLGSTFYRLDGATTRTGTIATTGAPGAHTLTFWSTDQAGNVEPVHTATFTVEPLDSVVTLSRSLSTISRGSKVRLSGSLTLALVGDYVRLQVRVPGSTTWRYIGAGDWHIYRRKVTSVTSTGRGTWSPVSIALHKRGTYYFRATFTADTVTWARLGDHSSTVSVRVR